MERHDLLNEANLLNKEITQLERFIYALDVSGLRREESDVISIIKKITTITNEYSIFGRRFFGVGAHEHTISVPTSMIPIIVFEAKALLKTKTDALNQIINCP